MASASWPRTAVGAARYSSSASAASTRCPARTLSMTLSTIKLHGSRRRDAKLERVAIEQLQPRPLVVAEMILNIIAQVPRAECLPFRRVRQVFARNRLGVRHTSVACLLQLLDVRRRQD